MEYILFLSLNLSPLTQDPLDFIEEPNPIFLKEVVCKNATKGSPFWKTAETEKLKLSDTSHKEKDLLLTPQRKEKTQPFANTSKVDVANDHYNIQMALAKLF